MKVPGWDFRQALIKLLLPEWGNTLDTAHKAQYVGI